MFDRRLVENIDFKLILVVCALFLVGVINLYSASAYRFEQGINVTPFFIKQIIWGCIGFLGFLFIILFDYRHLKYFAWYLYFASICSLLLVFWIGKVVYGARRWIDLGFFNFQPSELAKISTIILVAYLLSKYEDVINKKVLYKISFLVFIPFFLIIKQPDLGTAILLLASIGGMVFYKGIQRSIAKILIFFIPVVLPVSWFCLHDYQKERILNFLDPSRDPLGAGYHIIQSQIAIGSGRFWGKGFLAGSQSQLRFLPEKHTDFAFAVFAEEWGFVGAIFLLFLFCFFLYQMLQIAFQAKDRFGRYLVIGIFFYFLIQIVINMGMVLGLMPVVGVPLPFISYGGTSLVINFILVGLVINVGMRRFIFKNV
ncbi:rod shape determining protein RodA [Desulfonauticus submarinus]|uniref:Peptidoglycan glycosyltransferase RodA n=1 Tax=Desulfonauticus submarinus TaxID=206665 RepID=A0A1H0BBH6_9BACT|nr:rod shape determining protein RodA [Desulfonauticus submarinus]